MGGEGSRLYVSDKRDNDKKKPDDDKQRCEDFVLLPDERRGKKTGRRKHCLEKMRLCFFVLLGIGSVNDDGFASF